MKEIFVEKIIEENGITHGLTGDDKTVKENLVIVYPAGGKNYVLSLIKTRGDESFYVIDRFCQFIVFTQYTPQLGLSMRISDFHNRFEGALDFYGELKDDWSSADTDKIISICNDILTRKEDTAKMVIKDPSF